MLLHSIPSAPLQAGREAEKNRARAGLWESDSSYSVIYDFIGGLAVDGHRLGYACGVKQCVFMDYLLWRHMLLLQRRSCPVMLGRRHARLVPDKTVAPWVGHNYRDGICAGADIVCNVSFISRIPDGLESVPVDGETGSGPECGDADQNAAGPVYEAIREIGGCLVCHSALIIFDKGIEIACEFTEPTE